VIRGGSWDNNARNCRSANRNRNRPNNRNRNNGLRLAVPVAQRAGGCRPLTMDTILPRRPQVTGKNEGPPGVGSRSGCAAKIPGGPPFSDVRSPQVVADRAFLALDALLRNRFL